MLRRVVFCLAMLCWTVGAATSARGEEIVVAFSLDAPPYIMDDGKHGIEVEIVRAALKDAGYSIRVEQLPYGELADAVVTKGVDAAATVTPLDNGTYYSNDYITFRNAAITKLGSGLKVYSIKDLKGKSIVAWQNAYEDLGPEFKALFAPSVAAPYREKYREIASQQQQVEMFWRDQAEVIVIDVAVLQWFTWQMPAEVDTSTPLVYHRIFPPTTRFKISFKSEQVRNDFNAGLKHIRASGLYDKIYAKYLEWPGGASATLRKR